MKKTNEYVTGDSVVYRCEECGHLLIMSGHALLAAGEPDCPACKGEPDHTRHTDHIVVYPLSPEDMRRPDNMLEEAAYMNILISLALVTIYSAVAGIALYRIFAEGWAPWSW